MSSHRSVANSDARRFIMLRLTTVENLDASKLTNSNSVTLMAA